MPILAQSTYKPPWYLRSGHIQTVSPTLFRKVAPAKTRRERIKTDDGDFLDIDWHLTGDAPVSQRALALVTHGLEGSSEAKYVLGMARALQAEGYAVVTWSFRGCSGEDNSKPYSYHSGASNDLASVIDYISRVDSRPLVLVGFSIGGNITLKYLGEQGTRVARHIKAAVAFSVPVDLAASAAVLARRSNSVYMRRFLKTLCPKVKAKKERFPEFPSLEGLEKVRNFEQFDSRFVAPLHGFESAQDYWEKASSKPWLEKIAIPTLLVNAMDDPFFDVAAFPVEAARANPNFTLEMPKYGGHVGFISGPGRYWAEERAPQFLKQFV